MAQRSNAEVEDAGRPDLNEWVVVFNIPALCWSPGWMPGQIKSYPTASFKSKCWRGPKPAVIVINH